MNIRFITHKSTKYLRVEDVVETLRELGATEETDVRIRLETLASSLLTPNAEHKPQIAAEGKLQRNVLTIICNKCGKEVGAGWIDHKCEPSSLDKSELVAILEEYLTVTDEWGGCKLASWQWGQNVLVNGIDEAADEILFRLSKCQPNPTKDVNER